MGRITQEGWKEERGGHNQAGENEPACEGERAEEGNNEGSTQRPKSKCSDPPGKEK